MTDTEVRFPYQDASLDTEQRVEDLLGRMDAADKAGLLFHTMVSLDDPAEPNPTYGIPSLHSMVRKRRMNHFNLLGSAPDGRGFAAWTNALQRFARGQGLGIPITLSTDPRHAFSDNPLTSLFAGPFSQWPETLGFAALASPERLERFGEIARQEYLAVGLRVALHPQIDLATEPRWPRIAGTFGESADLTSALVVGYIRGFMGPELGTDSVATMVKHFPGGGPQLDGNDPHFEWGREQVYPGGAREYHLQPFIAAIGAGATQMMPYYGMPVGTDWEEVGFGFNKDVLTTLLRDRLGFDGIVCTDWGLLTDVEIMGSFMPGKAWGIEGLSRPERMLKALDAGVDQFGGELCTDVLLDLIGQGAVTEDRLDVSARRLLREKFRLGLFDNPYVDEEHAVAVVGRADFVQEGLDAQSDALTLLTNTDAILPLHRGIKVYAEGVASSALEGYATVVATPEEADVAIVRIKAPYEDLNRGTVAAMFHFGSLEFPADEHARLTAIAETVPTVIDIYLDRPAVLGGLEESARAVLADFGACDDAVLRVLFGDRGPQGSLPFDLPRSDAAVAASRTDVAFDTENPTFRFGHGLRY
ncbi:MAG: glycoside hydrolase family 3 C-terminal domain-containing protein [Actinobacteria bacterium]|nr:glycoside hydrolase family 3 C-terminal domain-containing protein [Actinomycetota bacterium]